MRDDDIIRSILEREARLVPMADDAPDALVAIAAALRRVTIKRTSLAVASTVLLVGGTVVAMNLGRAPDRAISIDSPVTPATVPPSPTIGVIQDTIVVDESEPDTTAVEAPATAIAPIEVSDDDGDPTSIAPEPQPPPSTTPSAGVPDDAVAPPSAPATQPSPAPSPATSLPPATATDEPTTTTAPRATVAPGSQITRYDSPCGSVVADLATTPPTLIEIVPADGYRYTTEDPHDHSVTVQFKGGGGDCEVKVGEPGFDERPNRTQPDDSRPDDSEPDDD